AGLHHGGGRPVPAGPHGTAAAGRNVLAGGVSAALFRPRRRFGFRPWAVGRRSRLRHWLRGCRVELGARPILAAAKDQQAALDPQHVSALEPALRSIGLAVLGIVDLALVAPVRSE